MPLVITTSGARCFGTPRNRSNGSSLPSSSTATFRAWSSELTRRFGTNSMFRSAKASTSAREVSGEGGTGVPNGITIFRSHASRSPRSHEVVVEEQGALARRRRALERRAADPDHGAAPGERREHLAHGRGPRDRVELVDAVGEPGRRGEVVVGPERDDEIVGLVHRIVRRDAPDLGIDRRDRLLDEAHAGPRERAVRHRDGVQRLAPEHDVELREAEDERVALVDQRDVDLVAEGVRQRRGELEPAEAGAEDDDACAQEVPAMALNTRAVVLSRRRRD